MEDRSVRQKALLLLVLVAATTIYAWILPQRYVTPDEGAHLMSARRILLGEFPNVDYSSRQPFYVLVHAVPQIFFGQSIDGGRWLSVVMTLIAGIIAYAMARRTGGLAGPLAAAFFLFSPLTIHYATVVQTQPVVIVTSGLAILLALQRRGNWDYVVGLLLAASFLVRESGHAATAAIVLVLLFSREWSRVRNVILGYIGGIVLCYLIYAGRLSPGEFWNSRMNPTWLVVYTLRKLFYQFTAGPQDDAPDETAVVEGGAEPEGDFLFDPDSYMYLIVAVRMLFGPIAVFAAGWALGVPRLLAGESRKTAAYVTLWAGLLGLFYAYWYVVRGFFPGYLREFELPIAVFSAILIERTLRESGVRLWHALPLAAYLVCAVQITRLRFPVWIEPMTLAFAGAIGLIMLARGIPRDRGGWLRTAAALGVLGVVFVLRRAGAPLSSVGHGVLFVLVLGLIAGLVVYAGTRNSAARNGRVLMALAFAGVIVAADSWYQKGGISFHGLWPRPIVDEVAAVVRENSDPGDEVMSGGMIWTFLADRKPFFNANHPLGYYDIDIDSRTADRWFEYYGNKPPAIVVLDGYTARIYYKSTPLHQAVERDYQAIHATDSDPSVVVLLHNSRRSGVSASRNAPASRIAAPPGQSPSEGVDGAPNRTAVSR